MSCFSECPTSNRSLMRMILGIKFKFSFRLYRNKKLSTYHTIFPWSILAMGNIKRLRVKFCLNLELKLVVSSYRFIFGWYVCDTFIFKNLPSGFIYGHNNVYTDKNLNFAMVKMVQEKTVMTMMWTEIIQQNSVRGTGHD